MPDTAGGRLEVDLAAIGENYSFLSKHAATAETAAAVKADAYGLGLDQVAPLLAKHGCKTFFVALPHEGARLRALLPDATIYVLGGVWPKSLGMIISNNLTPVLNSLADVELWKSANVPASYPFALQFDTGMNRLGLSAVQISAVSTLRPKLIMSHFACSDEPAHSLNQLQIDRFLKIRDAFPSAQASMANSAALLSRGDCQYDLVRPGIALYGGAAVNGQPNPMKPVVRLAGRIVQIREIEKGAAIGYGATHVFDRKSKVALVAVGYADGYHRAAKVVKQRFGFFSGQKVPLVGRISMDLSAFDVTDIPDAAIRQGDWIELIGDNIPVDELATLVGTIDYEILTSLGHRFARTYING